MVDFVQPIRISSLLSGYLDGDVTSRHQLEDFLVSDNFWSDIFLECSEHTSFLCDCSLSKLCLMLFSRRLRVYGCDESIGRALIDLLLPLSNLEGTRGPLAAVLADVVVRSPLEAALVVKHVLDWSCEDTFFCLLFLDEVAASAGRLASLPRDHSDEKREALISLHEGVLRFCLQVVSAPQLPEETRVGGVDCFTRWLTTDCLPPRALEARIFHPPPPPPPAPPPAAAAACWLSPVAAEDSSISDCSLVSAPEVLLLSCLTSPAACAALLSAAADLLEALFARCWEGRSCPEASRSSMPPEMRLSAGAADHLAISTARAVVGTGTVHMFRQSVLSSPDHCFGTVFLPDRYCFGTACGPELNTGNCTASVPLSPEAMRALTRVLGVTVKALVESSSNPFRVPRHAASDVDESVESGVDLDDDVSGDSESDSDYDGDDDSFDDEDTDSTEHNMSPTSLLAMELLAGLVTAAALREVSVALIALEACVFAHYRMTPAESLRGFYRLLLQAALRQCCVSYGRGHQDAMPSPLSVSMCCDAEWKLAREEVLSEVVRIVYLMLREEFLVFSSEILDQSLSLVLAFPGNEEVLGSISVVSGVIFALQTCSADLTRRSLLAATPSACSPELLADSTNTTQYLLRFLSTIFSHSFSAPSSAPLSRVFAHPEVANAMLCLIGSLSSWVSQASCGLDSRVTGALEGGVSDEGVGQCLQYLAAGYSCPATMLVASRALSEFCGHNSRSILHQRTVVAKEGWHFPLLDAIIEHCWSASVALTALGDEGLDQLGEGLELDPACCSEEGQDGAAVRAAIQRNTLRALCLVLGQIPPDSSDISSDGSTLSPSASRKRYQDCLLQALLSTLELVLSPPPQAEPCDTTTEIVVALQLLAAMVSSRVAVVSVIGLLTGKGERLGLLQPQEPPLSSKVSDSLCKLCTCVLRAAPECLPPRNCLDLAEELFLHHACHSRLCWGYVAAALEELGARGCHLQRMKQKIGSTFGELYSEDLLALTERCLHGMICLVCAPFQDLLDTITTLTAASPSSSPPSGDVFLPMRAHLLRLLHPARSSGHPASPTPFLTTLLELLRLFRQLWSLAPSLLDSLSSWISVGCSRLAVLCLSCASADSDVAVLAASVLSKVFQVKIGVTKRLGALASGQERSCTSWEQHILQLLCHPLDRAEVLAEALLRVVSTWQEAFHEDGAALHRNLAVECVLLLQHVLQYCSQCGMELKAVDSTEERGRRSPFSAQDLSHILLMFARLLQPQSEEARDSAENSFSRFAQLVVAVTCGRAPIVHLTEFTGNI